MNVETYLIFVIACLLVLYFFLPRLAGVYGKYRGAMLVTCPEDRQPAVVKVDMKQAVKAAFFGEPQLRLQSCSHWPLRQGCGQECLLQVAIAPLDCQARNRLMEWYAAKKCVYCGKGFGDSIIAEPPSALLGLDMKMIAWSAVKPERLHAVLATHKPVCASCYRTQSGGHQIAGLGIERV